jgi:hypothetical protein
MHRREVHLLMLEETFSSDLYIVVFSETFMLYFALINVSLLLIMNSIDNVK